MKKNLYIFSLIFSSMLMLNSCVEKGEMLLWNISHFYDGYSYYNGIMYRIVSDSTVDIARIDRQVYSNVQTEYEGDIAIPAFTGYFGTSDKRKTIGIGDSAFCDCTKLISVVLPATIQYVNKDAFNNCTALTTIVCKSLNPPTIDQTAFKGCEMDKITLYVTLESVDAYKQNDVWKSLNVKAYAVEE